MRIQEEDTRKRTFRMRPQVLGPQQDPSHSVPGRTGGEPQQARQRGPKNRPIYRLWEYATWRVRMRAWCNRIKLKVIKDYYDLRRPQTYKVVQ